jgi:hypothetical protein
MRKVIWTKSSVTLLPYPNSIIPLPSTATMPPLCRHYTPIATAGGWSPGTNLAATDGACSNGDYPATLTLSVTATLSPYHHCLMFVPSSLLNTPPYYITAYLIPLPTIFVSCAGVDKSAHPFWREGEATGDAAGDGKLHGRNESYVT